MMQVTSYYMHYNDQVSTSKINIIYSFQGSTEHSGLQQKWQSVSEFFMLSRLQSLSQQSKTRIRNEIIYIYIATQ